MAKSTQIRVALDRQRVETRKTESIQLGIKVVAIDEETICKCDLNRVSLRISQCTVEELRGCCGLCTRREEMEKVLRNDMVYPLHPRPHEAVVIHQF